MLRQRGTHTWDLTLMYHQCLHCGFIFESRKNFLFQEGCYKKNETCPRCKKGSTFTKPGKPAWTPLFGEPSTPEFNWEE